VSEVSRAAERLRIGTDAAQRVERAATTAYPDEACGLLLGHFRADGLIHVERSVTTANMAPIDERRHRFLIEPRLLLAWDRVASDAGLSVVGFFHSHPDAPARPSATDIALAWPGYAYVIVSTVGRPSRGPVAAGMAAWTFDDAARTFREMSVDVRPDEGEIDFVI
jgi:proteasome lid subunit RPN8/RPN11